MPGKYPEITQKIFTPNEYSQLVRRKFVEKVSEKVGEKVGRKSGQKKWSDNKQKSKMSPECHRLSPQ